SPSALAPQHRTRPDVITAHELWAPAAIDRTLSPIVPDSASLVPPNEPSAAASGSQAPASIRTSAPETPAGPFAVPPTATGTPVGAAVGLSRGRLIAGASTSTLIVGAGTTVGGPDRPAWSTAESAASVRSRDPLVGLAAVSRTVNRVGPPVIEVTVQP